MSNEEGIKINIEDGEDVREDTVKADEDAKTEADTAAEDMSGTKEAEDKVSGSEEKEGSEEKKEDEGGRKKHSGKKNKKDPRDEKIEQLEDRVKRQMAEFENFRKRTDREKSQMFDMGAKSVIEKILPVIDNFERGLESVPEGSDTAFVDGMQMIYKQLAAELEKLGVKPIEAVGQPFDPNIHNAVMTRETVELNEAVSIAQGFAEVMRGTDGDIGSVLEQYPSAVSGGEGFFEVFYDEDFEVCSYQDAAYVGDVTMTPNGAIQNMEVRIVRLKDYKEIYTLNATKYMNRTKG